MNLGRLALAAFLSLSAIACARSPGRSTSAGGPAPAGSRRAPTQSDLPTTEGKIAWANLEYEIAGAERTATDAVSRARLASLLLTHARYSSTVADYDRAFAAADEAVKDAPASPAALLARAEAHASLHRFSAARADLEAADALGAAASDLRRARASIAQAVGDLDEALRVRRAEATISPDVLTLGAEGALLGAMGRTDEALVTFDRALANIRDVSPFPVVWVLFQEAIVLERAGFTAAAKSFYAAAHERLPAFSHATSHLAMFEPPIVAVAMLEPIAERADDPEFEAVLADRLRARGDEADAREHFARAREAYEALLLDHPEAFSDHAGFFYLDELGESRRALALAKQNLAIRQDERAYELGILAAISAGEKAEACTLGREASRRRWISPMLLHAANGACDAP